MVHTNSSVGRLSGLPKRSADIQNALLIFKMTVPVRKAGSMRVRLFVFGVRRLCFPDATEKTRVHSGA
jgi:hypothetical protein